MVWKLLCCKIDDVDDGDVDEVDDGDDGDYSVGGLSPPRGNECTGTSARCPGRRFLSVTPPEDGLWQQGAGLGASQPWPPSGRTALLSTRRPRSRLSLTLR